MDTEIKDFTALSKNLKKSFVGFKKTRLAILADSASQFIIRAIKGTGIEYGFNYEIYEADYDQIDRQIFDSGSDLYAFKPEYLLILRSSEKLIKLFYQQTNVARVVFAEQQIEYTNRIFEKVQNQIKCKIIINSFPETNDAVFGNFSGKTDLSFPYQVKKLNLGLMTEAQKKGNLFLLQIDSLISRIGSITGFDPKMYITGDMVYSLDLLPYLAKNVHDIIQAIGGNFKKCLILDLDNTTWGGIIGDDGMEGIQIGDLGIGKAFTELQLWILELKKRGIILAVCSKNSEEIAKEPFEKHPDMKLHLDDIAVFVANWENKVDNIRYIQSVLNIGFDSMVFLDDSPFEREIVKMAIPEITVPSLPEDPAEYLIYLRSLNLFETASFTDEDEHRTVQYQEETQRNNVQKSFIDEASFLKSLEMTSEVKAFNGFSIPRIAQLTQRSNQFNLRTIRYTEEDVKMIADSDQYLTLSFNLKDKFGDYGLIACVILKVMENKTLFLDTWIMSCRVLKRGMEVFTLQAIILLASQKGYQHLIGEYIPTRKNAIVLDHYKNLGFSLIGENQWQLNLDTYRGEQTVYIK